MSISPSMAREATTSWWSEVSPSRVIRHRPATLSAGDTGAFGSAGASRGTAQVAGTKVENRRKAVKIPTARCGIRVISRAARS
jgi:hypothetical protein